MPACWLAEIPMKEVRSQVVLSLTDLKPAEHKVEAAAPALRPEPALTTRIVI